jgi:hypothetical protein
MNSCIPRNRLLGPALVILALATPPGCAQAQDGPAIDWDSSRMREIEKEWEVLRDAYHGGADNGKVEYDEYLGSVDRLLQKRLPAPLLRKLTASSKLPPVPEDQGTFAYVMLTYMVRAFVDSGDRQSLVELLAKRCSGRIEGPEDLEFYVAYRGGRLKDPILILGEAYAKCRISETRHALAASARRGFAGLGIHGKDDAEFVQNAMQWYAIEKGHLIVNSAYTLNETSNSGMLTIEAYEKNPDFYDNPPQAREPMFKQRTVPPGGSKNLSEDPNR